MLRKQRAWHEQEPRSTRALKGVLKALVGIGAPLLLIGLVITANTPKPPEQPPPPELAATTVDAPEGSLDGRWVVAEGSWAGYRILEELPRLRGKHEVVGRSTAVEGAVVVDGPELVEGAVEVDLRGLESDREWRDRVLHTRYLHIDDHPRATFAQRGPLALMTTPEPGDLVSLTLPGELTLHGVSNDVDVPVQVRWDGERLRVVGSLRIALADYDVSPPRIYGFRLVDGHGDIEIDLVLTPEDGGATADGG